MPKKSFKQVTEDNPALAFLGTQTPAVHAVHDKDDVQHVQDIQYVQHEDDVHTVQSVYDKDGVHHKDNVQDIHNQHDVQTVHDKDAVHDVQPVHNTDKPTKYSNINLRLRQDLKDYLSDASWQTRTTMTQYINNLIESDMRIKQESTGENNV